MLLSPTRSLGVTPAALQLSSYTSRRYYVSFWASSGPGSRRLRRFSSSILQSSSTTDNTLGPFQFLSNTHLQIFNASTSSTSKENEQNTLKSFNGDKAGSSETVFPSSNPFPTPVNVPLMPDSKPVVDFATRAFTCHPVDSTRNQQKAASQDKAAFPFNTTPVDAAQRSKTKTKETSSSISTMMAPYIALTKPRLSALVVLSAMSAYALTPQNATLAQLLFLTFGTTLASGSANAINMGREYIYDGMMTRTRTRPVVRGLVTPTQAFTFAGVSGVVGVTALYFGVNPTVAFLGASNIVLYGGLYTTLKRKSISNTWVGAVVGAIPPLMGWAASSSLADPGAWFLAALLYAWQFPHFNSLSHSIREEYRRAGYVMAAWSNPALNARVALRYSVAMFPICIGLSYFGVTDWIFAFDSSLINAWLTYWAYQFWVEQRNMKPVAKHNGTLYQPAVQDHSGSGSSGSYSQSSKQANSFARKLFWGSVIHLPAILVLAMIHKKGQWDWLFGPSEDEEVVLANGEKKTVLQSSS